MWMSNKPYILRYNYIPQIILFKLLAPWWVQVRPVFLNMHFICLFEYNLYLKFIVLKQQLSRYATNSAWISSSLGLYS